MNRVNFVGHIHIAALCLERHAIPALEPAAEADREPSALLRYLLGTALPDFAAIGRFQLRNRPDDPNVGTGIDVHHATDSAFHGHQWFIENCRRLTSDLRERGLNRGAARACGHVGVELLIDGNLLAHSGDLATRAQDVLDATDQPLGLQQLVEHDRTAAWSHHLQRIAAWTLPTDYHRPHAVAQRLQRILSYRPRLAFESALVDEVAAALTDISEQVVEGTDDLVLSVADEVAGQMADVTVSFANRVVPRA
jgi:hypothetical protein